MALRALKLGDFLTGIPALRALSRAFPDHQRILAAPRTFVDLLPETGFGHLAHTPDLGPLDAYLSRPDIAVDLHGKGPESQEVLLALEPQRMVSFASSLPATAGNPVWRPDEHEIRRWCRMLDESGVLVNSGPADPGDLGIAVPAGAESPWPPGVTVVHPGAASGARRWPPERFADVARRELEAGRAVVVTGSANERGIAESVAALAGLGPDAVRAGSTSLRSLIAGVACAGRVVCGDTGVAHVASAVGTPSVVLFGPVPPDEWGPPNRPEHIALWAGRRGDPHADAVDEGLLQISVEQVLEALRQLPERSWRRP